MNMECFEKNIIDLEMRVEGVELQFRVARMHWNVDNTAQYKQWSEWKRVLDNSLHERNPTKKPKPDSRRRHAKKQRQAPNYPETFEKLWNVYPRREGRRAGSKILAYTEYLKCSEEEQVMILVGAENLAISIGDGLPKDLERFIKRGCYLDHQERETPVSRFDPNEIPF